MGKCDNVKVRLRKLEVKFKVKKHKVMHIRGEKN